MSFQTVYLPSIQGITRVQNAAGGIGATNANNFNITFANNFTVGNIICMAICSQAIVAPSITTPSASVAFNELSPIAADTTGPEYTFLVWGKVVGALNKQIIITDLSTVPRTWCGVAAEYSGINISQDTVGSVGAPALGTNIATGAVTNNQPNALYIAALGQRFTSSTVNTTWLSAPGAPFNIVQAISTNLNGTNQDRGCGFLDAIVTTSASRTANATSGFSGRFSAVISTLAEIPAAVPTGAAW